MVRLLEMGMTWVMQFLLVECEERKVLEGDFVCEPDDDGTKKHHITRCSTDVIWCTE